MMITKHNLTFMLLLQSPERETGDRLNSGAFLQFWQQSCSGAFHTTTNEKRSVGVQKSPVERGPKGGRGVLSKMCSWNLFTILGHLLFWRREVWTTPLHHRWASSCPCRCNALPLLHNLLRIRLHSVFHTLCQSLPHLCGRLLEKYFNCTCGLRMILYL